MALFSGLFPALTGGGISAANQAFLGNAFGGGGRQPVDKPEGSRQRGGILGRIGRGLGRIDPLDIAMVQATISGDHATAARISAQQQQLAAERAELERELAQRQSLQNNLMKDRENGGFGLSPGEAERAMANPEAFGQRFNERYGTFNVAEGNTLLTPQGGAPPSTWTAPKTYEQGADIVTVDRNAGRTDRVAGMTAAEQNARALGLQPGTDEYNRYVRDFTLNSQGPTGVGIARERMQVDREIGRMNEGGRMQRHNTPGYREPEQASPSRVIGDIMAKIQRGERLTPSEERLYREYHSRGEQPLAIPEGLILDGTGGAPPLIRRNGQWVPHNG